MPAIIGIDPGVSGALACWTGSELDVCDMPVFEIASGRSTKRFVDARRLGAILAAWQKGDTVHIVVEQVSAMPGQGVTSMFGFGVSYGMVLGAIGALEIPMTPVRPDKWKRALQVRGGKDGARARATELLPAYAERWRLKKHDGRAEAALLALYGDRVLGALPLLARAA